MIAAANPIGGRYDISKTFSENVALTDPILTRFDVLCVMRDEVDSALDERLAKFVVDSHTLCHPEVQRNLREQLEADREGSEIDAVAAALGKAGMSVSDAFLGRDAEAAAAAAGGGGGGGGAAVRAIPQDRRKKYIREARAIKPALSGIDQDKVPRLYAELRRESEISGGIPIAVRHVESIMRMSEAAARMRHSPYVSDGDLNLAIQVMLESFISAQKYNVTRTLRRHFSKFLDSGADTSATLLLLKLKEMVKERTAYEFTRSAAYAFDPDVVERMEFRLADLQQRAQRHGIDTVALSNFINSTPFLRAGFTFDAARNVIVKDMR